MLQPLQAGTGGPTLKMGKHPSIPDPGPRRRAEQRQMTPDIFAGLLAALASNQKDAAGQYERLRSKLIFFFSSKSLGFPEDLADEVLDRLAHRLAEGVTIASLPAFTLGIAKRVALEKSAGKSTTQTMEETFWNNVPAPFPTHNEQEEKIARMEQCLKQLPASEAKLLRRYYLSAHENTMQARKSLADRLGISANTLRQRVFLARQSLHTLMTSQRRPDTS